MSDLLNPTADEIEFRNLEWAKDLRANPAKARLQMRDGFGGRCCLCVARDTAIRLGLGLNEIAPEFVPEDDVRLFFGWGDGVTQSPEMDGVFAAIWNDGSYTLDIEPMNHARIAMLVEAEIPTWRKNGSDMKSTTKPKTK